SENEKPPFPIKKVISLIIGALVVISVIVFLIFVIIPRFSGGNNKEVNLVYWVIWEDTAPLEEAAKTFTQKNPNIKVTIQKQDVKSLKNYVERLTTRINNG